MFLPKYRTPRWRGVQDDGVWVLGRGAGAALAAALVAELATHLRVTLRCAPHSPSARSGGPGAIAPHLCSWAPAVARGRW